jgi:hypothetical protein
VDKRTILIQLDADALPSVFDRIVALDAGADEVLAYGGVRADGVRDLIRGAIFTRGPKDLRRTAVFIGGGDVAAAEGMLDVVRRNFLPQFGLRVSVLLDPGGANTTAAAAVRAAARHLELAGARAAVLGGTGPVGQRVARLLTRQGARVRVGSRQQSRADAVCQRIRQLIPGAAVEPVAMETSGATSAALRSCSLVVAAGAAGAVLLSRSVREACPELRVAIDLNAVPPPGIEGVELSDRAAARAGLLCYGAVGVGDLKMKIHKAAVARLFESNDQVLDAEEVYALAASL